MGCKKIETTVYSCEGCGWVGIEPLRQKVEKLAPGSLGDLLRGSRSAQAYSQISCPICKAPIMPSPPVNLIEVASIEQAAAAPAG